MRNVDSGNTCFILVYWIDLYCTCGARGRSAIGLRHEVQLSLFNRPSRFIPSSHFAFGYLLEFRTLTDKRYRNCPPKSVSKKEHALAGVVYAVSQRLAAVKGRGARATARDWSQRPYLGALSKPKGKLYYGTICTLFNCTLLPNCTFVQFLP